MILFNTICFCLILSRITSFLILFLPVTPTILLSQLVSAVFNLFFVFFRQSPTFGTIRPHWEYKCLIQLDICFLHIVLSSVCAISHCSKLHFTLLPPPRKSCFRFVRLHDYARTIQQIYTKFDGNVAHGQWKNP